MTTTPTDKQLFAEAMQGVTPLAPVNRVSIPFAIQKEPIDNRVLSKEGFFALILWCAANSDRAHREIASMGKEAHAALRREAFQFARLYPNKQGVICSFLNEFLGERTRKTLPVDYQRNSMKALVWCVNGNYTRRVQVTQYIKERNAIAWEGFEELSKVAGKIRNSA